MIKYHPGLPFNPKSVGVSRIIMKHKGLPECVQSAQLTASDNLLDGNVTKFCLFFQDLQVNMGFPQSLRLELCSSDTEYPDCVLPLWLKSSARDRSQQQVQPQ